MNIRNYIYYMVEIEKFITEDKDASNIQNVSYVYNKADKEEMPRKIIW